MAVQEEGAEKKARRPQSEVSLDRCLISLRRIVDPAYMNIMAPTPEGLLLLVRLLNSVFLSGAAAISPSMVNPLAIAFSPSTAPRSAGLSVINRTIANTVRPFIKIHHPSALKHLQT